MCLISLCVKSNDHAKSKNTNYKVMSKELLIFGDDEMGAPLIQRQIW